jgi:hypothetical protein
MAKAVQLVNGRYWKTRSAALLHFRHMLRRYSLGQRIPTGPDHDDLLALVLRADELLPPGRDTKAGCGIEFFFKHETGRQGFSTPCFHLRRTDGSVADFGYITAVSSICGNFAMQSRQPACV